jgi:hypothetical protein
MTRTALVASLLMTMLFIVACSGETSVPEGARERMNRAFGGPSGYALVSARKATNPNFSRNIFDRKDYEEAWCIVVSLSTDELKRRFPQESEHFIVRKVGLQWSFHSSNDWGTFPTDEEDFLTAGCDNW